MIQQMIRKIMSYIWKLGKDSLRINKLKTQTMKNLIMSSSIYVNEKESEKTNF